MLYYFNSLPSTSPSQASLSHFRSISLFTLQLYILLFFLFSTVSFYSLLLLTLFNLSIFKLHLFSHFSYQISSSLSNSIFSLHYSNSLSHSFPLYFSPDCLSLSFPTFWSFIFSFLELYYFALIKFPYFFMKLVQWFKKSKQHTCPSIQISRKK